MVRGRLSNTEQGFSQALELDIDNVEATTNLGALLASLGRVREEFAWPRVTENRIRKLLS